MYVVHFDLGQFYQADGTKTMTWTNPNSTYAMKIHKTSLWGGISIGACMDFAAALYVTGAGYTLHQVSALTGESDVPWMPLEIMALDRYGASDGQNYQHGTDWEAQGLVLGPGQKLILQANCVQHGVGTNPVMGSPYAGDNCQAQAYIWLT